MAGIGKKIRAGASKVMDPKVKFYEGGMDHPDWPVDKKGRAYPVGASHPEADAQIPAGRFLRAGDHAMTAGMPLLTATTVAAMPAVTHATSMGMMVAAAALGAKASVTAVKGHRADRAERRAKGAEILARRNPNLSGEQFG